MDVLNGIHKMTSVEFLRVFLSERLTAVAEEIFTVVSKTIVEYEEEVQRQRKLLDSVMNPELKLHRIDLPQRQACEEKEEMMEVPSEEHLCSQENSPDPPPEQAGHEHLCIRERSSSQDQEQPEPPQVKEEQGEVWTSQEELQHVPTPCNDENDHCQQELKGEPGLQSPNAHVAETQDLRGGRVEGGVSVEGFRITSLVGAVDTCPADDEASCQADDGASPSSQDPVILPQTYRSAPWPVPFQIPRLSQDVEITLTQANKMYHASGAYFKDQSVISALMNDLAKVIFSYVAYPSSHQISLVAEALLEKFPCLKEPGHAAGIHSWTQRIKYKMQNYRAKLKSWKNVYPEIEINTLRRKQPADAAPARNVKKPKKAEVNFLPPYPRGENQDTLERDRLELINEMKEKNSKKIIAEKMSKTFPSRRVEVVTLGQDISVFKERWPALFTETQIKEEFHRITTVSLEETFMLKLDGYTPRLLQLMRAKGGAVGSKMRPLLDSLNEFQSVEYRRDAVICCLIEYLGEQKEELFLDQEDECEGHMDHTMKVLLTHNPKAKEDPPKVSVVLEGIKVLSGCGNKTKACVLLMGLIYALNLQYPKKLKNTFDVFQKLFLELNGTKLLYRVHSLKCKLS